MLGSMMLMMMMMMMMMMAVPCLAKNTRIIGGDPVGEDRYPYYALLRISLTQGGKQYVSQCGGTLITSQAILVRCRKIYHEWIWWTWRKLYFTVTFILFELSNTPLAFVWISHCL
jgi:hypothetical protein